METVDHWKQRESLIETLHEDAKTNYERMVSELTNLNRRNYIRSLFALYEAVLSNARERIAEKIINNKAYLSGLDLHEVYPLMDESSTIGENGKVSKRTNQTAFKNLLKYVVKLFCREYIIEENFFIDGWHDFVISIQIRHKITHPKYENDLNISDEELETIEKGRIWWNYTFSSIASRYNHQQFNH